MIDAIKSNSKILALFAIGCTAVVGLNYELTKERILKQEQAQLLSTLHSIVDDKLHDNDMSQHCITINDPELGSKDNQVAYLATLNDQPVAAAITTIAPDGYNGNIQLIVAMNIDGTITGARILKHKETPGLGDKIDLSRSNWILNFDNKTHQDVLGPRWAVAKDGGMFDQFTGATITPRAVVKAVKRTALYFQQHKSELFNAENQFSADKVCGAK